MNTNGRIIVTKSSNFTEKFDCAIAKYNGADGSQVWSCISRDSGETLSKDATFGKKGNGLINGLSSGTGHKFKFNMEANYPVLLFPVRLETRFMDNHLFLRIFPDEASIETHDIELNDHEKVVYSCYCEAKSDEDRRSIWRELVRRFGSKRAAWIIRAGDDPELINAGKNPESRQSIWRKPPRVRTLPDKFVVCLYRGTKCVHKAVGKQIPGELPMMGDPEKGYKDDLFNEKSKWVADWMADFDEAEKIGMAMKIPLDQYDDKHFTRVIAVGIKLSSSSEGQKMLEDLIDNHHYTSGFSFLPYDTPTNNTMNTKSGYSESLDDPEKSYDIECCGATEEAKVDGNNSQVVARAFGLDPALFCNIENADVNNSLYERELKEVLWPVFGENFLKFVLSNPPSDNTCRVLQDHLTEFVTARGPLPAVGIGDQPYGILPVTRINGWKASRREGHYEFYTKLHAILFELYKKWLDMAMDPELVPRVTDGSDDADDELLRILAMEPVSTSYGIRPVVKEPFLYDFRSGLIKIISTHDDIVSNHTGRVYFEKKTGNEVKKGDLLCSVGPHSYFAPLNGKILEVVKSDGCWVNKGDSLLILHFEDLSFQNITSKHIGSVFFNKKYGGVVKKGDLLCSVAGNYYFARSDGKIFIYHPQYVVNDDFGDQSKILLFEKHLDLTSKYSGNVYFIRNVGEFKKGDQLYSVKLHYPFPNIVFPYFAPFDGKVIQVFKSINDEVNEGDALLKFAYDLNIYCKHTGIVEYKVDIGQYVEKGDLLFSIKDVHDDIYHPFYATSAGKVLEIFYPNKVDIDDTLMTLKPYPDIYDFPPWIFPTSLANEFVASIDKNTTLREYAS